MMSCFNLIRDLAKELNFTVFNVNNFHVKDDLYIDLFVFTKDKFDYFLVAEIPFNKLSFINSEIQIALSVKLRKHIDSINDGSDSYFEVSHYFDKNTTFIITTEVNLEILKEEVYKQVSAVEEDSYYFKKQVVYYTYSELDFFKKIMGSEKIKIYEYCGSVISSLSRYESYVAGSDLEYDFISKLYEKLPFLNLSVVEEELLNLDDMINSSLSEEENKARLGFLSLNNDEEINNWIDEIGIEND